MNARLHRHHVQAPLVSVLMPCFNNAAFLADAIDSILQQSMPDFELILIDDGSQDASFTIAQRKAKQDARVVLVHQHNAGISSALNLGLAMARGQFIARMDADDIAVPERFALQLQYLQRHPDIDMVGSWIRLFGAINETWHYRAEDNFIKNMLFMRTNGFGHNTIMARRAMFSTLSYDSYFDNVEDTDLWCRLLVERPELRFANMRQVLVYYRTHQTQGSQLFKQRQQQLYDEILTRLFSHLGCVVNAQDMADHRLFCQSAEGLDLVSMQRLYDWVTRLQQAKNQYVPDEFGVFPYFWHRLCLKNQHLALPAHLQQLPWHRACSWLPVLNNNKGQPC